MCAKMVEIVQSYKIDEDLDNYGYNQFIREDLCEIRIFLGSLMDRKNMAFKKLVKRLHEIFLLEFICADLQAQGLWNKSLCGKGTVCNIRKTLHKINYFLW